MSDLGMSFSLAYTDQRMKDPIPTFTYLVEQLKKRYPNLAYLHTITPLAPDNKGPEDPSVCFLCFGPYICEETVAEVLYINSKRTS